MKWICTVEPLYNGHHWDQALKEVTFAEGSIIIIKYQQEKCEVFYIIIQVYFKHVHVHVHCK